MYMEVIFIVEIIVLNFNYIKILDSIIKKYVFMVLQVFFFSFVGQNFGYIKELNYFYILKEFNKYKIYGFNRLEFGILYIF